MPVVAGRLPVFEETYQEHFAAGRIRLIPLGDYEGFARNVQRPWPLPKSAGGEQSLAVQAECMENALHCRSAPAVATTSA